MTKQPVKAGTSKASAAHRRKLFVDAYLANGRNATQAAITAGYSPKTAVEQGSRLLRDVNVAAAVQMVTERVEQSSGLTAERVLREISRLAFHDARKFYDDKGNLKPIHELDDDTAAGLAGFEVTEEFEGKGADRESVGFTKKVKFWDKNTALVTAARHLGLFEKDNSQRGESLALQVVLVQPNRGA